MSSAPTDLELPPGVRVFSPTEVAASSKAAARSVDGVDPVAVLIERIAREPLAAWEPASLALVAPLRGQDDLAYQRVRVALKKARADVAGWERALNEVRRRGNKGGDGGGANPPALDVRERYTDAWNASRFAQEFRSRLRYVPERGWFAWTGSYWRYDLQAGTRFAQDFACSLAAVADEDITLEASRRVRIVEALGSRSKIQAIEVLARARPELTARMEDFDRDEILLNCANGLIDLRAGALGPHEPDALCTREVEVEFDPEARAPVFEAFLARVQPDEQVRAFLQRWAGYCATACTSEQCLVLHWGTGANGKSTFVEAINFVLGRYAQIVPSEVLLARAGSEGHPTERAQLCGLRHALVSETANGKGWNENAVKQLTGDTKMTARFMRQDNFEFTITHKLSVCTNNRPEVRENSHAFWRRVHLIPWAVQIPENEKDQHLLDKLRAEAQGILAWIVRGAVGWYERGLAPPPSIRDATEQYRTDSDRVGQFLEERTRFITGVRTPASMLFKAWSNWCEGRGDPTGTQTAFGERLRGRPGIERVKVKGIAFYKGIALRELNEVRDEDEEVADGGGRVEVTVAPATLPLASASEFADETSQGERGEGCGEVLPHMRAPAPAGLSDAPSRARALQKQEASLAYADSRDNSPQLSPFVEAPANLQFEPGGRVAASTVDPTRPPAPNPDWEEP